MKDGFRGCWPTMITPFTEDGKLDFKAVAGLVDWYARQGADGIFAVCQSSEMFFLSDAEKLDLAKAVVEANHGRMKIIASGHTEEDLGAQIRGLEAISKTGVDAVVLVSNRLVKQDEGPETLRRNAELVFNELPEVKFGLYECPYPFLRLLDDDFLSWTAATGKLLFLKDVSCSLTTQARRSKLVSGSSLALFNANTSTVLESWKLGYKGYNGVMANFHLDLYKWMFDNFRAETALAEELSDFLTLAAMIEARAYPVSAKYYQNRFGVPMSLHTRSRAARLLNENDVHEIEALHNEEKRWRRRLGL